MSFYSNLAKTAKGLLVKFGQKATVTHESDGTYDPVTGITSAGATTTFTANAAIFDYETSEIDGTVVQKGDSRILLDSDNKPLVGSTIQISGAILKVVNVLVIAPSNEAVIYDATGRR